MTENRIKTVRLGYTISVKSPLEWVFPPGTIASKFGDTAIVYQPKFRFIFANFVTVIHTNASEFSLYFTDFFPIILPPSPNDPYNVFPQVRITYPATDIDFLLRLCEDILSKHEISEENEIIENPIGLLLNPIISPQIPVYYANTSYFYYDSVSRVFRVVFGERMEEGVTVGIEGPDGEKKEIAQKTFLGSIGIIIPYNSFRGMTESLKKNIDMYKDNFESLPLKKEKIGD